MSDEPMDSGEREGSRVDAGSRDNGAKGEKHGEFDGDVVVEEYAENFLYVFLLCQWKGSGCVRVRGVLVMSTVDRFNPGMWGVMAEVWERVMEIVKDRGNINGHGECEVFAW